MVQGVVAPRAADIDRTGEYPWDVRKRSASTTSSRCRSRRSTAGRAPGTLMLQMAVEEIAKACASSALILMVQELGTLPIQLFGTDEQKQRFLPPCATRRVVAGVRAVRARGRVRPRVDAHDRRAATATSGCINGQKNWITNATIADFYVVFAKTDRESNRITAFIVETDREGFDPGQLEHKLGIKGVARPGRRRSPTCACPRRT